MGEAIGDLVDADLFEELLASDEVPLPDGVLAEMERSASNYARTLRRAANGPFGYPRQWDPTLLTSSMRTTHTPGVIERFEAMVPGETEPVSRFPRLSADHLAPTLLAGTGQSKGSDTSRRCHGTDEERNNWEASGDGTAIHWPDLDEDVSVGGLISGPSLERSVTLGRWLLARQEGRGIKGYEIDEWRRSRSALALR